MRARKALFKGAAGKQPPIAPQALIYINEFPPSVYRSEHSDRRSPVDPSLHQTVLRYQPATCDDHGDTTFCLCFFVLKKAFEKRVYRPFGARLGQQGAPQRVVPGIMSFAPGRRTRLDFELLVYPPDLADICGAAPEPNPEPG